jgi:hypothetical protein
MVCVERLRLPQPVTIKVGARYNTFRGGIFRNRGIAYILMASTADPQALPAEARMVDWVSAPLSLEMLLRGDSSG